MAEILSSRRIKLSPVSGTSCANVTACLHSLVMCASNLHEKTYFTRDVHWQQSTAQDSLVLDCLMHAFTKGADIFHVVA